MKLEQKRVFLINIAFVAVVAAIIFFVARFMLSYLLPFLIGVILAFVMQKPAEFISSKIKLKKGICAAVMVTLGYVAVAGAVVLIGWLLISAVSSLAQLVPGYMESASAAIADWRGTLDAFFEERLPDGAGNTLEEVIGSAVGTLSQNVTSFVSGVATSVAKSIPGILVSSIVTVVASFYIAKDFDKLLKFLKGVLGDKLSSKVSIIKGIVVDSVFKYIKGYLLMMCITFCELLIGFLIIGIKKAPLIAIIVAIVDLLPVLGTGTVLLPWAVILLISGSFGKALAVIALYAVITVVRNVLEPKVIGDQVGVNPLITLITMFVGLRLSGIAGMFLLPVSVIVIITYYKRELDQERAMAKQDIAESDE